MTTPNQGRRPLDNYLHMQLRVDRELNRVLELAARQSSSQVRRLQLQEGDSIGTRVRIAQYQQVLADLARIQRDTWQDGIGPIIQRNYSRAQQAAEDSFSVIERILITVLGENRAALLLDSFRQAARNGLELDRLRRVRELSPRVYRNSALASGAVERNIRAGIIQGLSARELAANVRKYISPTTPGGVSYAAMRLARTELNNAFHEASKIQAESAPWVNAVVWNRSRSHKTRDRCDVLATQDIYELGSGCYPADRIPDKPHPQCLCYTTYRTVSESDMLDMLPSLLGRRIA